MAAQDHQRSAMDCSSESMQDQEVFVWPWMGILTNVPAEQTQGDGSILMKQLADFKPVQYTAVNDANGYTGYVVVLFTKDWTGFKNALAFHNYFKSQHLGKLDWKETKSPHVKDVFGWLAKEEDYKSDDPVGRFLSSNGGLKTVSELEQEMSSKTDNLIAILNQHITTQSKYLQDLECKCNQMNLSLKKVSEESDLLHKRYNEEMRNIQSTAREHTHRVIQETEKLRNQLAEEESNIGRRSRELYEQVAQTDLKRRKLEEERNKNADQHDSEELTADLTEKIEEIEALVHTLFVKEWMTNVEIEDAKKELITGLSDLLGRRSRSNIRIKWMGELDEKPFFLFCKQRYGEVAAGHKASVLVSLWQERVKDPNWHPFKIVTTDSTTVQVINDKDEELVGLKQQFGEEVYMAVTTALLEINEYNASGRYPVSELWNKKENPKASIAEAIHDILKQLKAEKRRLTGTS